MHIIAVFNSNDPEKYFHFYFNTVYQVSYKILPCIINAKGNKGDTPRLAWLEFR